MEDFAQLEGQLGELSCLRTFKSASDRCFKIFKSCWMGMSQCYEQVVGQQADLHERLDELFYRLGELERKLPSPSAYPRTHQSTTTTMIPVCVFNSNGASHLSTNENLSPGKGDDPLPAICVSPDTFSPSLLDAFLVEEAPAPRLLVTAIAPRAPQQLQTLIKMQPDVLSCILMEILAHQNTKKHIERGTSKGWLGSLRTRKAGLGTAAILIVVGVGTLGALIAARNLRKRM